MGYKQALSASAEWLADACTVDGGRLVGDSRGAEPDAFAQRAWGRMHRGAHCDALVGLTPHALALLD